ncbi:hypothetical protein [Burkholderia cenocepacia]|uniref:hypothetical protein n=1 Tax=Burkholderia cenocepacia TaxID=95486 RepID=UPI000AF0388E|nr:hypothetical protein [Burkholderia cenocepacia]HEM7806190.1 hypothetical protein [Burkholderia cenocepacia]
MTANPRRKGERRRGFADLRYDRIILPAYFFDIGSRRDRQGPGIEALKRRPGPTAEHLAPGR